MILQLMLRYALEILKSKGQSQYIQSFEIGVAKTRERGDGTEIGSSAMSQEWSRAAT